MERMKEWKYYMVTLVCISKEDRIMVTVRIKCSGARSRCGRGKVCSYQY